MLVTVEERFMFFELCGVVTLNTGGSAFFRSPVSAREGRSAVRSHVVLLIYPEFVTRGGKVSVWRV